MRTWIAMGLVVGVGCTSAPDEDVDTDGETDGETDAGIDDTDIDLADLDPCFAEGPLEWTWGSGEEEPFALTEGQDVPFVFVEGQGGGAWHHAVWVQVRNAPQWVSTQIRILDVESGLPVTQRDPVVYNRGLTPTEGPGALWSCEGGDAMQARLELPGRWWTDTDAEVEPWETICGRRTRFEVVSTWVAPGGRIHEIGRDAIEVITQPDPRLGAPCTE
jgi:hypothetical protein